MDEHVDAMTMLHVYRSLDERRGTDLERPWDAFLRRDIEEALPFATAVMRGWTKQINASGAPGYPPA